MKLPPSLFIVLSLCLSVLSQLSFAATSAPPTPKNLQPPIAVVQDSLVAQMNEIGLLKAEIEAIKKSQKESTIAWLAPIAVVVAALIAGFIALRNQNRQAEQGRLLKAIEIIMESRSGYQADNRKENLGVFLDATTKDHLKGIRDNFAGPEFTDLHLALAQAMSEKVSTPEEVLEIWRTVLKGKKFFDRIEYPPSE